MDYDDSFSSYMKYVDKCRDIIKNSLFCERDFNNINFNYDNNDICDIIKSHRLKMIDIKIEHTFRMVEQIIRINKNMNFMYDLDMIVKIAVLYHDIGRIRQATWSNTFSDVVYKKVNSKFNHHGEDGYDIFMNNDFGIDKRYVPLIGKTILYHPNYKIDSRLNYTFNCDLTKLDINNIIVGNSQLNDNEWQIASLVVQLVADIDKADILYQYLSNDFDMSFDYVYDYSRGNIEDISRKWEVDEKEILEYNKMDYFNYKNNVLRIPVKNMPISKLEVSENIKGMFYNNNWLELSELIKDSNWNFVSILWWRLSYFLNGIVFNSTLNNIYEVELLDKIYYKIPDRLKPVFQEAFDYAINFLVLNKIKENKGNIYLKRK